MDGLKVPFRSSSQQLSLDSFSCRFVRGSSMRPAPAKEGDASLADIAVRVTAQASIAAAAAAAAAETGEGAGAGGAAEAGAAALLDSSAVEDQVRYFCCGGIRVWEDTGGGGGRRELPVDPLTPRILHLFFFSLLCAAK